MISTSSCYCPKTIVFCFIFLWWLRTLITQQSSSRAAYDAPPCRLRHRGRPALFTCRRSLLLDRQLARRASSQLTWAASWRTPSRLERRGRPVTTSGISTILRRRNSPVTSRLIEYPPSFLKLG